MSPWVLHTVDRGHRIQLGSPPPRFNGVYLTLVGPEQALVMEQEVEYSLEEGGHQGGPSSRKRVRVLQLVLHSSQEGWRVASHFRSASVEPLSQQTEVQVAHTQTGKSEDWFVDLKDVDFHISILPTHREFLRFAFGGKAYQYRVLPFGLALSPRTFTKCVDAALAPLRLQGIRILNYIDDWLILAQSERGGGSTSRCCSRSLESVGVKTEHQEECAFSITENHLSWCGVRFDHDAGTYVPCSDRIDPHRSQESEGRPVTHCQAVSEAAGSDGSCVQCDTYWSAVYETLQGWLKTKGFSQGKPALHDQGHTAVPMCLGHVETTLVLSQGADILSIKRAGAEAQGMDASPRGGEADLESVWPGSGGPLRYSGKYTVQCPLWYSLIHPAPLGLDAMVQTWSTLCLYVVPRSLCSREFWRECAGTRSVYLWYHRSGRGRVCSRT